MYIHIHIYKYSTHISSTSAAINTIQQFNHKTHTTQIQTDHKNTKRKYNQPTHTYRLKFKNITQPTKHTITLQAQMSVSAGEGAEAPEPVGLGTWVGTVEVPTHSGEHGREGTVEVPDLSAEHTHIGQSTSESSSEEHKPTNITPNTNTQHNQHDQPTQPTTHTTQSHTK